MARLTVEDCIERVPNRFELVMLSAQRARELGSGGALTVEADNDKNPVIALREIAEDTVDLDVMRRRLVHGAEPLDDEDSQGDEIGLSIDPVAMAAELVGGSGEEHNEAAFTDLADSAPVR